MCPRKRRRNSRRRCFRWSKALQSLIHIGRCIAMRTNIVLDEKLVKEAMKIANVKTKREAVHVALRRFVQTGRQKRLLDLYGDGGVRRGYDYKKTRSGD